MRVGCKVPSFDALLILSFGGPEGPAEVEPFLNNVVRGRRVPPERLAEVAKHYDHFGGVSPINAQIRALLAALIAELNANGPPLAVYWGNRHWHPMLEDAIGQMAEDGIGRAMAFCTSAFGSYPGCRQYREDIERARAAVGGAAPRIDKLRLFYNHPGFIETVAARLEEARAAIPAEQRSTSATVFTAHSIPSAMAASSPYEGHVREACRLVAERAGLGSWHLAYQSRSGPPSQPWLEPDLRRVLETLAATNGAGYVTLVPIGFVTDHMEVVYDLDIEAAGLCEELGLGMVRASTVGCHPRFVRMIRELALERVDSSAPRLAVGSGGPPADECTPHCCPPPGA